MNIADYIASGILESYVLDELSASERVEVEKMIKDHAEVREELDKIESSIENLAVNTAIKAPFGSKEKIMSELESLLESEQEASVISLESRPKESPILKYAAAASIAIAIGSGMIAFDYRSKWLSAKDQITDLISENRQFAQNYNTVNQRLKDIKDDVAILNNATFTKVVMEGTANAPRSLATVYWNEITQEVYLAVQELGELSEDQQYQLWAIIDGKPVSAGVFDLEEDLLVPMQDIPNGAAAFAVTIEPQGGSEAPSLDTMQVLGNV